MRVQQEADLPSDRVVFACPLHRRAGCVEPQSNLGVLWMPGSPVTQERHRHVLQSAELHACLVFMQFMGDARQLAHRLLTDRHFHHCARPLSEAYWRYGLVIGKAGSVSTQILKSSSHLDYSDDCPGMPMRRSVCRIMGFGASLASYSGLKKVREDDGCSLGWAPSGSMKQSCRMS